MRLGCPAPAPSGPAAAARRLERSRPGRTSRGGGPHRSGAMSSAPRSSVPGRRHFRCRRRVPHGRRNGGAAHSCSKTTRRWRSAVVSGRIGRVPPSRASSAARSRPWPSSTASCRRACGPQLAALRAATVTLVPPYRNGVHRSADPTGPGLRQLPAGDCSPTAPTRARSASAGWSPHRLVATDRRWYLVAYDLEREDWRTFRVDRISDGSPCPGHTFVPRQLDDPARMVAERYNDLALRTAAVVVQGPTR